MKKLARLSAALFMGLALLASCEVDSGAEPLDESLQNEQAGTGMAIASKAVPLQSDSFYKNLVIIDPIEIAKIDPTGATGRSHFKTVFASLVSGNVDTVFGKWAASWDFEQTRTDCRTRSTATICDADSAAQRGLVTTALTDAWSKGNIDLVAVVNRIDLAKFVKGTAQIKNNQIGEFRLVYQLQELGPIGPRSVPFSVIMEFKLPVLAGDAEQTLQDYAKEWTALANLQGNQYSTELARLVRTLAIKDNLLRIRTDEEIITNAGWDFRQFYPQLTADGTTEIVLQTLTNSPMTAFKLPTDSDIYTYAIANETTIVNGTHEFDDIKWTDTFGTTSGTSWTWLTTADRKTNRAYKIIAANTCTGCHDEVLGFKGQHISYTADLKPVLSDFLTSTISVGRPADLAFAMPDCDGVPPRSWCSATTWNEPEMRKVRLALFANPNMWEKESRSNFFSSFNYRYH